MIFLLFFFYPFIYILCGEVEMIYSGLIEQYSIDFIIGTPPNRLNTVIDQRSSASILLGEVEVSKFIRSKLMLGEHNFTYYNSYIFILGSFQCLSFIFTFNYFSIQKESTFKNRILTIYLIIVALILLELISVGVFDVGCFKWKLAVFVPLGKGNNFSQKSRIILFGFCVLGFFLCMLWEYIIYYCLVDRTAVVGGMIKVNDNNSDKASEGLLEKEMDLNNMKDNLSED